MQPTPLVVELLDTVSMPLVWLAIALFLTGTALEFAGRRLLAVPTSAAGWVVFGAFWVAMFPHFYLEVRSPLQAILSLAALPLSLYVAYLLIGGRDSLLILSRSVALMGLIYLPVTTIDPARAWLIETVTVHSHFGMELVGYSPGITEGPEGYQSMFAFDGYTTYIVLACTGLGAISIFGGLIAAVRAPLRRKLLAFGLATGVIYVLNLVRNVFVGLAAPLGWFDYPVFEWLTVTLAGEGMRTSFFISHHVISQTLSIVALIGITLLVVRVLPEIVEPLEEVLFVLTGTEYDLDEAIGQPVRTDGGGR